jgi:CDP-glycerol glycerophosphotransferase (TagB/SpsB family)
LAEISESFVYFPLHLEPEATTLVYCPTFNDQANAIDVIAKSLPSGVSLLIKENPKMWGKRPIRFYERANRNAGVIWAQGDAPSQEILERCEAVLTLTSTTALEATLLDKPVACFGRPPFVSALPSLPTIDSLGELPQKVAGLIDRSAWPQAEVLLEEYATYVANLLPTPFYGTTLREGIPMPAIEAFDGVAPFVLECLPP